MAKDTPSNPAAQSGTSEIATMITGRIAGNGSPPPGDTADIDELWVDPGLGDGITTTSFHTVAIGKPKDFFRTHPLKDYRRRTEFYVHKPEGAIDEQYFIVAPSMRGKIVEARPCVLIAVIYRDGTPRLWPVPFPRAGERDNDAWKSARMAARAGIDRWVKLLWMRRAYTTREAAHGYAPDPAWDRLPPFNELVRQAFGEGGVIRDENHPIYRELFGAPQVVADSADDSDADDDI
jgi:hypothetical protein